MTEILWQQLEDRIMILVSELEKTRSELKQVRQDYSALTGAQEHHSRKLQDLLALLDNSNQHL